VNVKANPTALEFAPEGGAIFIGTRDGKLLLVDLRGLDKAPKTITICESGNPIQTMSMQVLDTRFVIQIS
jgi:protein NEDD1